MKKILFVCTGNICRSSTAEAILRHIVKEQGHEHEFIIDSCGTHGYHVGEPSDLRAVKAAQLRGINMDDIRARQISSDDFQEFDYIIAMDRGHESILKNIALQEHHNKISLFLDHSTQKTIDVPDPYYGDIQGFEEVLDVLEEGMGGLLRFVQEKERTSY